VLAASGLIAGEALTGLLIAALAAAEIVPKSKPALVAGVPGEALTLLVTAAVCGFLLLSRRRAGG